MSLTIIYSTRTENPNFTKQLLDSCYNKDVQIIEIINNGVYSLSKAYNIGIEQAINNIIVCCHDDISLSKGWDRAILKDFKENPEFGILGKAGSLLMDESGIYWSKMSSHMCGLVNHLIGDKPKYLSNYSSKINGIIPVVTVDGLFIAFSRSKIKHTFDEYFEGFHLYDHGMVVPNYLSGVGVGVTFSFDITHKSMGETNSEFDYNRLKFIKKYNDVLPIEIPNKKIFVNSKNPIIPSKKQDKISIIICHKDKNELLFKCVKTLILSTSYNNYEIIIADTGSSEEKLNELKNNFFIDKQLSEDSTFEDEFNKSFYEKVKLINYDYYNFAKINNNIVKNHLSTDSKFILFLNNDVEFTIDGNNCDNDVISRLYEVLISKNNIFSVGTRLIFSQEGKIQHGGHFSYLNKQGNFEITHAGLNSYYSYYTSNKEVIGNTGACMMVRRNVFSKLGMFNENYTSCFEDCEINMKGIIEGYKNIFVSDAVAIHRESSTRNTDPDNLKKLQYDYQNFLAPFVQANIEKLKPYIHQIN